MPTVCSSDRFEFARVEGRAVLAGFDGGTITSDAGTLLLGATDRAIGLVRRFAACFADQRAPEQVEHDLATLVGQRVFALALGYEDLLDHDTLRHDPVLAAAMGKLAARRADCAALAGKSTLNRLEHAPGGAPTRYHKIGHDAGLIERLFVELFLDAHRTPPAEIVLDLDATDDPLHGSQEGRFFHGYYGCYCYLPLYVFCGDHLLVAKLRRSDIDASAGAVEAVARLVGQIRARWPQVRIVLRADSGFARDGLMAWAEQHRVDYVLGLARNSRLVGAIAAELAAATAEAERTGQPARCFKDFRYQTLDSWSCARRVVGKAEQLVDGAGEPSPNPRFVVTNLAAEAWPPRELYEQLYCARGEMENRIKDASSTCSRTAPRPGPCGPTSCAYGSRRWPTCCSRPCAGSRCRPPGLPGPRPAPSASSCSRSAPWCKSPSAGSRSPWPPATPGSATGPSLTKPSSRRQADHDPDSAQSTSLDATLPAGGGGPRRPIPRQPYAPTCPGLPSSPAEVGLPSKLAAVRNAG